MAKILVGDDGKQALYLSTYLFLISYIIRLCIQYLIYFLIDCTVQCVVKIFEQSACANIVAENWRRLARSLNTPAVFVSQQNHKLLVNILTRFDVIEELLMEWRSRMSENSTLGELLKIVEN